MEPVWLVSEGRVVASARRTTARAERRRGLIGNDVIDEPLVIDPCAWVHTIGMRVGIEVAFVDDNHVIVATARMRPWRVGAPVRRSRIAIEAAEGSFERWGIAVGDIIEVRRAIA